MGKCALCGKELNIEELYYYTDKCTECIGEEHNYIESWRTGRIKSAYLDKKFEGIK